MRLRAQNPPLTGIYLATEFVSGGAPDTIRKAFRQRSRWSKVGLLSWPAQGAWRSHRCSALLTPSRQACSSHASHASSCLPSARRQAKCGEAQPGRDAHARNAGQIFNVSPTIVACQMVWRVCRHAPLRGSVFTLLQGPWEMLFSKESPLWYARGSGPDNTGKNKLSIRDRISFLAPVYNVIVNAVATPFLCFVPVFWMFTGHFPASRIPDRALICLCCVHACQGAKSSMDVYVTCHVIMLAA